MHRVLGAGGVDPNDRAAVPVGRGRAAVVQQRNPVAALQALILAGKLAEATQLRDRDRV